MLEADTLGKSISMKTFGRIQTSNIHVACCLHGRHRNQGNGCADLTKVSTFSIAIPLAKLVLAIQRPETMMKRCLGSRKVVKCNIGARFKRGREISKVRLARITQGPVFCAVYENKASDVLLLLLLLTIIIIKDR